MNTALEVVKKKERHIIGASQMQSSCKEKVVMNGGTTALWRDTQQTMSGALIGVANTGKSTTGVTQTRRTPPSGTTAPHEEELDPSNTLLRVPSAHRNVARREKNTIGVIRASRTAIQKNVMIPGTTAAPASTKQDTVQSVWTAVVRKEKTTTGAR